MPDIEVRSPISGSVWRIVVKTGDRVAEDDAIIILESMKMEIPLIAPEGGTVKELRVVEGQTIGEGDVAVVLEA